MTDVGRKRGAERRTHRQLAGQVKAHLRRKMAKLDVGLVRGQPFAPYLCPDTRGISNTVSLIFMSYGFSRRAQLLIRSLDRQQGIADEQLEIITFADHNLEPSSRFDHRLNRIKPSVHKAYYLNQGADIARGDLLVFTDADALFPPYFLANLLTSVRAPKLHISVRKELPVNLVEWIIEDPSLLEYMDYQGLRDALPDRWSFDWILHTPSGFLHVLSRDLFYRVGGYDVSFTQFDEYDWEFCNRVFAICGQPILVPDMWAIHMNHPRDYTGRQIRSGKVSL